MQSGEQCVTHHLGKAKLTRLRANAFRNDKQTDIHYIINGIGIGGNREVGSLGESSTTRLLLLYIVFKARMLSVGGQSGRG